MGWVQGLLRWLRTTSTTTAAQSPPVGHAFAIRPDYSPCCEWHGEHAFRPDETPAVPNTHPDDPSWSALKQAYIASRLGAHPLR